MSRLSNKILRFSLLSLLALAVTLSIVWALMEGLPPRSDAVAIADLTPSSVTQFAYDSQNSASVRSSIFGGRRWNWLPLESEDWAESTRYMPLFVSRTTDERLLLFSTRSGYLSAFDLNLTGLRWSTQLPATVFSTPVVDLENGRIYLGTLEGAPFKHDIHVLDLDGRIRMSCPMDVRAVIAHRGITEKDWSERIHCRTSMGLMGSGKNRKLYFGCSRATNVKNQVLYGDSPGLTGMIVAYTLNGEGDFKSCRLPEVFETSAIVKGKPYFGNDTGVYAIGSRAALLPGDSLLVGTGNGPVDLDAGNFGCSVVRLNSSLKVERDPTGGVRAFSRFGAKNSECWPANIEYSSSAPAWIELSGKKIAGILSKDGYATLFDADEINPQKTKVFETKIGGNPSYSQPAIWKMDADRARFIFLAHKSKAGRNEDELVVTEGLIQADWKILERECHGYLKKQLEGEARVALYYSGPYREDYAVAVEGSKGLEEMQTFFSGFGDLGEGLVKKGLWAPFEKKSSLGSLFTRRTEADAIADASGLKVSIWKEDVKFVGGSATSSHPASAEYFYLTPAKVTNRCPKVGDQSLIPLYRIRRVTSENVAAPDSVHALDVNGELKVTRRWVYELAEGEGLSRAHPVISMDAEGKRAVVVVTLENRKDPTASQLIILDAEDGKVLSRTPFTGQVHFSMPLIFGDTIAIGTKDSGLKVFKLQK